VPRNPVALANRAHHEAGHMVMAWWFGIPIQRASLVKGTRAVGFGAFRHRTKVLGYVAFTPPMKLKPNLPGIARRFRLEAQICMLNIAGPIAEQQYETGSRIETMPEYQECQKIIDSIYYNPRGRPQWRRQAFMNRVILLTEGILLRHWAMLTRIASALKERRELSSEKINELIVNETALRLTHQRPSGDPRVK
jgi:hypothetical protein